MSGLPTEYLALVGMTVFFLLAWFPASVGKARTFGTRWLASNRDQTPQRELPLWAQRSDRAYSNLKDYFPAFVVAILILGALDKFDEATSIAAVGFVMGRLVHFTAYGLGNFLVRALSYAFALGCNLFLLVKTLI
jgi:uncharacterized MAPEG superfamily protein